jgi:hypothetical protein
MKTYIFTYNEEFTTEIEANTEAEAMSLLDNAKWEMLGKPHKDFLAIEELTENNA